MLPKIDRMFSRRTKRHRTILQTTEPISMTKKMKNLFERQPIAVYVTRLLHPLHFHKASDKKSNFMGATTFRALHLKQDDHSGPVSLP